MSPLPFTFYRVKLYTNNHTFRRLLSSKSLLFVNDTLLTLRPKVLNNEAPLCLSSDISFSKYFHKPINSFNKHTRAPNALNKHTHVSGTFKRRNFSNTSYAKEKKQYARSIVRREREGTGLSVGQKVVSTVKVTTNFSIIIIGIGLFGVILYIILTELFGSSGITKTFNESLEKIRSNPECQKILGTPMKGYGHSRRRYRTARFQDVINSDGTPHRIMQFSVEGSISNGKALLDMVKDDRGNWFINYLIVNVPGYGKTIFVEYHGNGNDDDAKQRELLDWSL
ncbi:18632_t:CDS:2 [Acaulospora morrowiae]|uniref:Mitochondrial import inner membrane translocase subunit Tim21 n=1 Tax=Acaulospora morrowiae TaxID=94023 RepID=A0A9N9A029_9GLOM|nr:18632_t:CDS:2 [Acaulospora morrowiae]